jgi:hypothetical protein
MPSWKVPGQNDLVERGRPARSTNYHRRPGCVGVAYGIERQAEVLRPTTYNQARENLMARGIALCLFLAGAIT